MAIRRKPRRKPQRFRCRRACLPYERVVTHRAQERFMRRITKRDSSGRWLRMRTPRRIHARTAAAVFAVTMITGLLTGRELLSTAEAQAPIPANATAMVPAEQQTLAHV